MPWKFFGKHCKRSKPDPAPLSPKKNPSSLITSSKNAESLPRSSQLNKQLRSEQKRNHSDTSESSIFSPAKWRDTDSSHDESYSLAEHSSSYAETQVPAHISPDMYESYGCLRALISFIDMDPPAPAPLLVSPDRSQRKNRRKSSSVDGGGDERRLILALDLDETLVHSTLRSTAGIRPDRVLKIQFCGEECQVFACFRPHLSEFLDFATANFEVTVFTASQQVYADKVLECIDPEGRIKHRFYRNHCTEYRGLYLKDLRVLASDMKRVCIIDNSPSAFAIQPQNGIPIESWMGEDKKDEELLNMMRFLERVRDKEDVRGEIKEVFKVLEILENMPVGK